MRRIPKKSEFVVSLFATASPAHQDVFYTVARAGHLRTSPEHRIRRDHFPGHELILCLRGQGFVRVEGVTHGAGAGDLVWINCHHPHEHFPLEGDPWEVLWVRMEGPRLEQVGELLGIASEPVTHGVDVEAARAVYERVFALVEKNSPEVAAEIHAELARLLALVFAARQKEAPQARVPAALRKAVEQMKLFYFEPHTVASLASGAGMSVSHFARLFRAAFGASPIDWLRRERVSQAKRRLVETKDSIQSIAQQTGYSDRFFFSKDFKKMTGFTPREFRARERSSRGGELAS